MQSFPLLPIPPAPVPALPASVSGCASRGVRAVQVGPVVVAVVCLHAPSNRTGLEWCASFAVGPAGSTLGAPVTSTLCLVGAGVPRSGSRRVRASAAAVMLARRLAAASAVQPSAGAQLGLGV